MNGAQSSPNSSTWLDHLSLLSLVVGYGFIAFMMIATWIDPMSVAGGRWVKYAVGLFVLEFILVHSGVFLSVGVKAIDGKGTKIGMLIGLIAFYTLFAVTFALVFQSLQLFLIYALLMLGRLRAALSNQVLVVNIARSVTSVLLYLFCVFGSVLIPVPRLGVTRDVVWQVYPDRGEGLWEQEPHRVLVFAALYFILMACAEIFILRKMGAKEL